MRVQLDEHPAARVASKERRPQIPPDSSAPRGDGAWPRGNALHVLIVADAPLSRSELATLLAGQLEGAVISQVEEGADLAAAVEVSRPDVVVWDLGDNPASALDRLADLADPGLPVVILVPDEAAPADVAAAGVRGVLRRDADGVTLRATVRAVTAGLLVADPALATLRTFPRDPAPAALAEPLTSRELEVLQLMTEGLSNKGIAERLGISENTAKFHVNAILGKLGAQNRTEAVTRAARQGLIIL